MALLKAIVLFIIWWLVFTLNPGLSVYQFLGIAVAGAVSFLIVVD